MPNPRDILNQLKWKPNTSLEKAEIYLLHRGAPQNTKIIYGKNIIKLEKTFMHTTKAIIPYHRIQKINYQRKTIFIRPNKPKN